MVNHLKAVDWKNSGLPLVYKAPPTPLLVYKCAPSLFQTHKVPLTCGCSIMPCLFVPANSWLCAVKFQHLSQHYDPSRKQQWPEIVWGQPNVKRHQRYNYYIAIHSQWFRKSDHIKHLSTLKDLVYGLTFQGLELKADFEALEHIEMQYMNMIEYQ